jgi:hypothetical protein
VSAPVKKSSSLSRRSALGRLGLCGIVLALSGSGLLASATAADAPTLKQYELKAAYIYNFAKFTAWPPGSFTTPEDPLVIGILGNEQIASVLEKLTAARAVNGRKVEVRVISSAASTGSLHVLYVDESQDLRLDALAKSLSRTGLLSIGESERFLSAGGTIRFIVGDDRLQFEINSSAARLAGLTLSSQLLMLAKAVR